MLLLLSICIFLLGWYYVRRLSYWSSMGIAEVPGLPFLGNLLPVITKRQAYFQLQEEVYKAGEGLPYIGMYNLTIPTLVIREIDLIEAMIKDDAKNFEDHGLYADPSDPLSLNLFYLNGKQWKWVRSKLRCSFSTIGMKNIYPEIQRCVDEFLENIEGKMNVRPTMDKFTLDILAKAVFSVDSSEGFLEAAHQVYNLSGLSSLRVFLRMFFPKTAIALGVKMVPQRIEDFFRNALSKSVRKPGSFLDLMFHLKETEEDFNDDLMLGQFFIFILAGFETTATALTFALYLLAKHPEAQEKARAEICEVVRKYGNSYESHKEMIYLDYIINETLRLYSPVASMLRVCEGGYRLPCGAQLPPGTPVVIPYIGLHRDSRLYHRPLDFLPERWAEQKPAFFYPFGLGPRNCIGMQFALLELKTFLSSFLLKYSITSAPSNAENMEFEPNSFFIVPKHPIIIHVKPKEEGNIK